MSTRDFFAAHAPDVPDWFKYEAKTNRPVMPAVPDSFTSEQRQALDNFVCHETCHDRFVSQFVRRRQEAKAAQEAWRDACREKKFFAWRWHYADQMMEMSGSQRTTRSLYESLGLPRHEVYRLLKQMQEAGAVQNRTDRRMGADGEIIGATWVLTGHPLPPRSDKKRKSRAVPALPRPLIIPPRDPMMWAVFGVAIEARP